MFVIVLTYVSELDVIDGLMREHMDFLNRHYADGTFLLSGRQVPRTGGIVIAKGDDVDAIQTVMQQDPFVKNGAATFQIIRFNASQAAPALKPLLK